MSLGVIESVSEVVEWKIPDFFSLDEVNHSQINSPPFSLAGCKWNLQVHPKGLLVDGYMSVYLSMRQPNLTKIVTFSIGIKTGNSITKERTTSRKCVFKKGELSVGWKKFLNLQDLQACKLQLAPLGALTFICHVHGHVERCMTVLEEFESCAESEPKNVDSPQMNLVELETLSSDFKDLLVSERKYDVTVNVQGKDFRAHRAVLSARSSVFRATYEHDTAEDETGVLTITDCDPESFGEFLTFLYTGKTEDISILTAYNLYVTADKYDVQQLKSYCATYLKQNMTAENVCDVVVLADRYGDDELVTSAEEFFNENYCAILSTSEWTSMMKKHTRLADKLLKGMAFANFKKKKASSLKFP